VFAEAEVQFAVGDVVRITGNGRDVSGRHRVDNGRIDRIRAFTPSGGIMLENGWELNRNFGFISRGLVQTSPASQSKTEDIVLAALNRASLGAVSARQTYVTISRGRERGMIFSDLSREELLETIARDDKRKSATELFAQPPAVEPVEAPQSRVRQFVERVRETYRRLAHYARETLPELVRERELSYER
jgi:hypothetical protein